MIKNTQKGLLHIYPDLAGLDGAHQRRVLLSNAGVESSADPNLSQEGFERAMAAYEALLWDRVDRGVVPDPRHCRKCGRAMERGAPGRPDRCPEGCERRKVNAWTRDYWRQKLPADRGGANSRQIWKLRELWTLLQDYLPEAEQADSYLAAIISRTAPDDGPQSLLEGTSLAWHRITAQQAHRAIEALKDRLAHAVRKPKTEDSHVPF